MVICVCNHFNDKVITEHVRAHADHLPAKPSEDDLYDFYQLIYKECGLSQDKEGTKPRCHACLQSFLNDIIQKVLEGEKHIDHALVERTLHKHGPNAQREKRKATSAKLKLDIV